MHFQVHYKIAPWKQVAKQQQIQTLNIQQQMGMDQW